MSDDGLSKDDQRFLYGSAADDDSLLRDLERIAGLLNSLLMTLRLGVGLLAVIAILILIRVLDA